MGIALRTLGLVTLLTLGCGGRGAAQPEHAAAPGATSHADRDAAAAPAPARAIASEERYVLIEWGARVYLRPDAGAFAAVLGDPAAAERQRRRGVALSFAVLRDLGEWLEVENTAFPARGGHCYGGVAALASYRLRLYVRREAVLPVLTRPFERRFDDGTAIGLRAGVLIAATEVGDDGAVRHMFAVDGLTGWVTAGDAVGDSYVPGELGDPPTAGAFVPAHAIGRGALRVGDVAIAPAPRSAERFFLDGPRPPGPEALAAIETPCLSLEALIQTAAVELQRPSLLGALRPPRLRAEITPDGVAYWPDGTAAGIVVARGTLHDEVEPRGELRCFRHHLAVRAPPEQPTELTLCFAAADVSDPPDPRR